MPAFAEDSSANAVADTLEIADTDGDNQTVTLTVTSGTVSIDTGTGVNITTGDGTDDASLVFDGTLTQVNAALDSLTFTPDADFDGTATIQVQTDDGNGGTDDQTLNVTVDDAPEVVSINRAAGASDPTNADSLDFEVTFGQAVSGVDATDFSVTGSTATVSNVATSDNTTFTVTVSGGDLAGLDGTVGLDLADDDSITSQGNGVALGGVGTNGAGDGSFTGGQTFTVDNTAPMLDTNAGLTLNEDAGVTTIASTALSASDGVSGAANLTYIVTGGPANGALSANTFTQQDIDNSNVTFTPDADFAGTDSFTVDIADAAGNTLASQSFSLTVNAVNDAPGFNVGADQSVGGPGIGASLQTVAGFIDTGTFTPGGGADESGQAIADFIVSENSDPDNVVSGVDIANDGTLTFTPADGVEGTATIDVQVQDDGGTANGGGDTSPVQQFDIVVDTKTPTVLPGSSDPANGDTNVPSADNIKVAFSEDIAFGGSGTITLFSETNATSVEIFDVSSDQGTGDGQVSITGSTLTINPSSDLPGPETFSIDIEAGAIEDTAGNPIAAFDGTGTLEFTSIDPDALITTGAGFDTTDGTNIQGGIAVNAGDNVLQIADPSHLDASAVVSGGGGSNTIVLDAAGSYDFAALNTALTGFDTLRANGSGATKVTVNATSGLDDFTDYIGQADEIETLEVSGASVDLVQESFTDWDVITATTANATLDIDAGVLNDVQNFTATGGGTETLIGNLGSTADLSGRDLGGFEIIENTAFGDTTFKLDGGTSFGDVTEFRTGDRSGADTLETADTAIDVSGITLTNIDTLATTNATGTTFTIKSSQTGLSIDGGKGTDQVSVTGGTPDVTGLGLQDIETLDFEAGATATLDQGIVDSVAEISGAGGTERLVTAGASLDLSGTTLTDIEEVEGTGGATTFTVTSGQLNTLDTFIGGASGSTIEVTGTTLKAAPLTLTNVDTFTTTNTTGTDFDGTGGDDKIVGNSGDDSLSGGAGADTLTGGDGADAFRDSASGLDGDTITDFSLDDRIVVTGAGSAVASSNGDFLTFANGDTLELDTNDDGKFDTSVTLSNFTSTGFHAANVSGDAEITANAVPTLSNLDGDTGSFQTGGSAALDAGGDASVADADSTDFDGGRLTVARGGGTPDGDLTFDGGPLAGGDTLTVNGTVIGTVATGDDGQGGNDLVIDLNVNATAASVGGLLQGLGYTSDNAGTHDFDITLADGDGATSAASSVTIDVAAPPPPPPPPPDEDDDDLFSGDDQSEVDNDVDTGLEPTDDFEDGTIDGAPATTGTTTDRDTGESVEVIAVNPVADGERQDEDETTGDVDIPVSDTVRASISDNTGIIIASRASTDRDALATVLGRGRDPDDTEEQEELSSFLDDVLDPDGDGSGEDDPDSEPPAPVIEVTPVPGADDADGQERRLSVNVETGGDDNAPRPVVVVNMENFTDRNDTFDIDITGAANIVVRGGGSFQGTEELADDGAPDIDNVLGDASDQVLFFGPGDDVIRGGGGDDEVASAGGADRLFGGSGSDSVRGGDGADTLDGGPGADRLFGDRGADTLVAAAGDSAVGGLDGDTLELTGFDGTLTLVDPTVHDRIVLTDRTLGADRVRVETTTRDGEDTAVLRLDLDGDGVFLGTGEAAIELSRLARAEVAVTPDGTGGTEIALQGSDMQLLNLSPVDQVSALYVGFLGRAPDPAGLAFWLGEYEAGVAAGRAPGRVFDDIAEAIRLDEEAMAHFPVLDPDNGAVTRGDIEGFVTAVFESLFNRAPEAAGLDYWADNIEGRLDAGINMGDLVVDIMGGALDGVTTDIEGDGVLETVHDASTLRNKIETGQQFAARLEDAGAVLDIDFTLDDAGGSLDGVGGDFASFEDAIDRVDTLVAGLGDEGLL